MENRKAHQGDGHSNISSYDYTCHSDVINNFNQAMQDNGLICLEPIIQDGRIHRFANGNRGNKNCWYVLFEHGGAFGDWSQGISQKWFANQSLLSYAERQATLVQIKHSKYIAKQKQYKAYEKASMRAFVTMQQGGDVGSSPYLERKQVKAFGIKFHKDFIAIPLRDIYGKLWNVQRIYPNGNKLFLSEGKKKGCFHLIGSSEHLQHVYVCEGYATGASIHMATSATVVVCFDAHNIAPVIATFKSYLPALGMTITADNDCWKQHNTGRKEAEKAAKTYRCMVMVPEFSESIKKGYKPTDFNDLHVLEGLENVRKQLQ